MDTETGAGTVTTEAHRPSQPRMPYADADRTLRALAAAAEGFGRRAIGGLHGALYHVTSLQGPLFTRLQFCSGTLSGIGID